MSTLQVVWDETHIWDLCAFDRGFYHQAARITKRPFIENSNIYFASIGPVAEEPTQKVVLKFARGTQENDAMQTEYKMYNEHLIHLQGTVIPRCYGYFKGKSQGKMIGCMVLEQCLEDRYHPVNKEEFNREIMTAICKIHAAGVEHRRLLHPEAHHIVKMGLSPRIVDFSTARLHHCHGGVPAGSDGQLIGTGPTCQELTQLELYYGLRSGQLSAPPLPRPEAIGMRARFR